MPNPFEIALNEPLPQCCSLGSCCKGASPSTPYHQLLKRAANPEDNFARTFFSIMIPYKNHAEAETVVPGLVSRTKAAALKQPDVFKCDADLVFYHCRFLLENNRCGIWEDRPQFCRDYPDTPFIVMAPGCAFEPWRDTCQKKFNALKSNVDDLKQLKKSLREEKRELYALNEIWPELLAFQEMQDTSMLSLVLSLTPLYLASPYQSFYFF